GKNSKILLFLIPVMAILAGFAFYDYVYIPVRDEMRSIEEMKEAKMITLNKYIDALARKPSLEKAIASLRDRRSAEEAKMVEGQTPSVAAANLQNLVKEIIVGKGGTVSSERMEKPEELGRFKVVTVSIETIVPETKALTDMLVLMESQPVSLFVRELDVRIRNMREPRDLTARFRISALNVGK
ncbi:MAG: type II secretion system protein GspM, partial [Syntrophales bacterium]|nr:type II secretion system protein GspM [Syntrophales bacterium]